MSVGNCNNEKLLYYGTFYTRTLATIHLLCSKDCFGYRDPQPQVIENYSCVFNLRPNINKYLCLYSHLISKAPI